MINQCYTKILIISKFKQFKIHLNYNSLIGIAINKEGVIYIADNLNIRQISTTGIISTLIGSHNQLRTQEPMSCDQSRPANQVSRFMYF